MSSNNLLIWTYVNYYEIKRALRTAISGRDTRYSHIVCGYVASLFPENTRGGMTVILPIFIRFYNCSYEEMHIISLVHPLPVEIIFHKVSLIVNILFFFPSLCEMLYAGIVKLLAEASEISRALCCSSSSSANGVLWGYPSEDQEDGIRKMLNLNSRGDEGDQSTPLSHLPPLCVN